MKTLFRTLVIAASAAISANAAADEAAIKKALTEFMPSGQVDSITPAEIKGLYEVTMGANIFYASEDGKYLLQGQLFDAEAKKNITETKQAGARKNALDKVGEKNMIIFKPESPKHQVSVFTDIDCGYCRKLHSEMEQYQAQGITIRYLFFPRAGKGSDSYKKAVSVWCAPDRNKALTSAKKGENLDSKACDNPVDNHMALGEEFGMNGTPMIVTEKGNVLPGYVPAAQLAKILSSE
ncbi:DsbC family protein [Methylomonas sp. MED-D]|uniref:Thiol:disulfide interchange protein n=1 Tax=Methylomonas koyamae TaxID=702114 RepID=A0A177NTJ5_9GAMM|nr:MULTISPECIES: DsbC family protein [Methylomonas]NJA05067.1 DsbC family protein [Methylococcaceae bacterium WWC4]MDT4331737.1 DsbC family protein [Methylomonas sp. MV1]OAI20864.1 disulfide bond formation protein DsbC [Methylomonas koyamae]OHX36918.1 disulfide bond formation protein DsbC [Methylomonas sp. LWB]WGS84126.1 DsbC family protein [Methylomonas sp. UP202]